MELDRFGMTGGKNMNVIVSSCLLGLDCKYCEYSCNREEVANLAQKYNLIPVCPEQIGGLSFSRPPIRLTDGRAICDDGKDYTEQFVKGADGVLKVARNFGCQYAVLKSKDAYCICKKLNEETDTGNLIHGCVITAEKLRNVGVLVVDENSLDELP